MAKALEPIEKPVEKPKKVVVADVDETHLPNQPVGKVFTHDLP